MSRFTWSKRILVPSFAMALALTACSNDSEDGNSEATGDDESSAEETDNGDVYSIDDFENIKSGDSPVEGGSITYGLATDTAFEGILNWNFYQGNPDAEVLKWFDEPLLDWDENYVYTNDGAASYETSDDNKTFTLTIRDNVNWHDGEPVTAEDWAFAYETIGHPDYTGIRYDDSIANVEGMKEYHDGESDSISGINVIDEKTLEVTFINATPSLITGGLWNYPLAKHIFGDMEVGSIAESPEVRQNPIGFGPYKVDSIVPGESVVYTKNEDYWRGAPHLDQVTLRVINPNVIVQSLESGEIDIVEDFPVSSYPDNAEMEGVEFLGTTDRAYSYIGFKLGKWDAEAGENVVDPDAKMADVNLRKAMAHAIDNNQVGDKFYYGLRWGATTLIPPSHPEFHDETNEGFPFDPELSKQLLDDAGYVDTNDDGFRETPDGEELSINLAAMSGDPVNEPLMNYYMDAWEKIGLNVNLVDGRLQEFNSFYDRVEADDPDIDMYSAAWGVGIDVDPDGIWGKNSAFNYTRWTSDETTDLIKQGLSDEAFDVSNRVDIYNQWQEAMVEQVPAIPTLYRANLTAVNERVNNYAIGDGTGVNLSDIYVTE